MKSFCIIYQHAGERYGTVAVAANAADAFNQFHAQNPHVTVLHIIDEAGHALTIN